MTKRGLVAALGAKGSSEITVERKGRLVQVTHRRHGEWRCDGVWAPPSDAYRQLADA